MLIYDVLDTQVTVLFSSLGDLYYAVSTHHNKYALEEVVTYLQAEGWLLDELVYCSGGYWGLSMVMDQNEVIL